MEIRATIPSATKATKVIRILRQLGLELRYVEPTLRPHGQSVMPNVVIDGVEYVPISKSNPNAEQIARGIMEMFWGELPKSDSWEDEAKSLRVNCSDSLPDAGRFPTVMEVVGQILARTQR